MTFGHLVKPLTWTVDSRLTLIIFILVALLCAVISMVGLVLLACCAWLWRSCWLKKKALLRSLPKLSYEGAIAVAGRRLTDCPICLTEFVEGDEIHILPPCRHGFHVGCVDTWLGSHSSCPFCQRVLVVFAASSSCHRCGVSSAASSAVGSDAAKGSAEAREDSDANMFLPEASPIPDVGKL